MINSIAKIERRVLPWALILLSVFLSAYSSDAYAVNKSTYKKQTGSMTNKQTPNTFESPDFAFPEIVAKNAADVYAGASGRGHWLKALNAAMQLCVVQMQTNASATDSCLQILAEPEVKAPSPYNGLAKMIKASLLCDYYNDNSWQISERILPQDSIPESVALWDRDMFQSNILRLVSSAINDCSGFLSAPIADFSSILKNCEGKEYAGFTLGDFLYNLSFKYLAPFAYSKSGSIIPFRVVDSDYSVQPPASSQVWDFLSGIASSWTESLRPDSSAAVAMLALTDSRAYLQSGSASLTDDSNNSYASYWRKWADFFNGYPAQVGALSQLGDFLASGSDSVGAFVAQARKALAMYPDSFYAPRLSNQIENLLFPSSRVYIDGQYLPDKDVKVKLYMANLPSVWIHVIKLPKNDSKESFTRYEALQTGLVVNTIQVSSSRSLPFGCDTVVNLGTYSPGRYTIILTRTSKAVVPKEDQRSDAPVFVVSNLALLTENEFLPSSKSDTNQVPDPSLFIVDGENGAPVEGARVQLFTRPPYSQRQNGALFKLMGSAITDADGRVSAGSSAPDVRRVIAEHDGNRLVADTYLRRQRVENDSALRCAIFLDRAIAKPGQNIAFEAVFYTIYNKRVWPVEDRKMRISLRNASGVVVDSISVVTDKRGNAHSEFTVPSDGMLGQWLLEASVPYDSHFVIGSALLRVEEYKTPTFAVTVECSVKDDTLEVSDYNSSTNCVVLKGSAITYSGMPVANAMVDISIDYRPWRFGFGSVGNARFNTSAVTLADGTFEVCLSTDSLRDTPFATASYMVTATVTSQAGESQHGSSLFSLGRGEVLSPQIPDRVEVRSDSVQFNVPVRNMVGNPVSSKVRYEVRSDTHGSDEPLLQGEFLSPVLNIPADMLPSGNYKFRFSFADSEDDGVVRVSERADVSVILWRADDILPPVDSPLWVPQSKLFASPGADTVEVRFGSAPANQAVLCVVSDSQRVLSQSWIRPQGKMVSVKVPTPAESNRVFVNLLTVGNLESSRQLVTILPASEAEPLKCETVSFRNRLEAGQKERWQFRFSKDGKPQPDVSALAAMTDKALDSLVPFSWYFSPLTEINRQPAVSFNWWRAGSSVLYTNMGTRKYNQTQQFKVPDWRYDFSPFRNHVFAMAEMSLSAAPGTRGAVAYDSVKERKMSNAVMKESVTEESADADDAFAGDAGNGASGSENINVADVPLRESECPVAFFRPSLSADADGVVRVDFDVPDFNTTWKFSLLGYNSEFESAELQLDAVSAKPVMVQINAPRFVRTSDKIVISATAFNNSEAELPLAGKIEVFNPISGAVLKSVSFKGVSTPPAGSRLLNLDFNVPANVSLLAVRAYALANGSSDGEQVSLQVLPSSSPVIESSAFYLAPSQNEFSVKLPSIPKDASVTLTYCDNPLWYSLTALPSLVSDDGVGILSVLRSLYGRCIGYGLMRNYPALRSGLEGMLADDAAGGNSLKSPLEINPDLKVVALTNTPWVNNASSETLRMRSLSVLLDSVAVENSIRQLADRLTALRRPDGGFAWCPQSESSLWATSQVLLYNAMLGRFGYMPNVAGYRSALSQALAYYENEWLSHHKKHSPTDAEIESLRNFLYVRSFYKSANLLPKESKQFQQYARRCLELVAANWRNYDIYDKATAASLLQREGKVAEAHSVLESVSQFASRSEEKGMWFDALPGSDFSPWNTLITTVQVLEAYMDINPSSPDVDMLRQWLLRQRQTQDWGSLGYGAELVQALLTSGSNWVEGAASPVIKLNGKVVVKPDMIPPYGEVTVNLDASKVSGGSLSISRSGNAPSWGGVVAQFVAPISNVSESASADLSVRKDIFLLRQDKGNLKALPIDKNYTPVKGELVRVVLTVQNRRDMEYVVLADERAACLEPVEQLSEHDVVDSVWLYREVRNSNTNFFIPYLRKGSFSISYDCRVSQEGDFTAGIATIQSQYAPTLSAHSAGMKIEVDAPVK